MTVRFCIVLALVLSFSSVAWSGDSKDEDAIQGTWLASTAEFGGQKFPDEVRKSIKLVIKDGKYTVTVGKELDKGTSKLVTSAKPKAMDIMGTDGPNKGKTMLAIYELNGDTLRVCYDVSGMKRPRSSRRRPARNSFS